MASEPTVMGDTSADDSSIEAALCHGCTGWYVEWFQEDASVPLGYRVAHWYGSREACEQRMKEPAPALMPPSRHGAPPYDAATATGMYD